MSDSFEDAIKEAFTIAPATKVILHTLEVRQTGVQDSVYIVQGKRSITAKDENGHWRVFIPLGFQFSLPPSNEEGFRSLNIAIDNIGKQLTSFITTALTAQVPIEILYRPYMSDDLETPQMNPPLTLWLKDVQITAYQVVGKATFLDIVNMKFPAELYTRARFPTLGG